MNLTQLSNVLAAAGASAAQEAQQIAVATAHVVVLAMHPRRSLGSLAMYVPDVQAVTIAATQPFGVYQENVNEGVSYEARLLDEAAQQMAAELAAAAAGLITGAPA